MLFFLLDLGIWLDSSLQNLNLRLMDIFLIFYIYFILFLLDWTQKFMM